MFGDHLVISPVADRQPPVTCSCGVPVASSGTKCSRCAAGAPPEEPMKKATPTRRRRPDPILGQDEEE